MDERTTATGAAAEPTPELSVVIPAYNEAPDLAESIRQLARWLATVTRRWELWVIDDGSTDSTRSIAEDCQHDLEPLQVDGFARNRGRGAALRLGLQRARGDVVLTTEADLSWGVEVLERLAESVRSGAVDMAVASPHAPLGRFVDVPWRRRVLSSGANWIANRALGHRVSMATGATRAYRRSVLPRILSPLDGKAFHLDTLCRALRQGVPVGEVPATLRWRDAARGHRTSLASLRLARDMVEHLAVLAEHLHLSRRST